MLERLRQFPITALSTLLMIAIGGVTNVITGENSVPGYVYAIGAALVALVLWIEIAQHRKPSERADLSAFLKILQRGLPKRYKDQLPEAALYVQLAQSLAAIRPPRVLERLDFSEKDISKKPISEVFEEMGSRMLVLGEPGAGKTTLLYELALQLLGGSDAAQVPLVFNLTTWAKRPAGQSLDEWLAVEMTQNYAIGKDLAREFLAQHQLALLLDGLDELAAEQRKPCVAALNEWVKNTACPVAICCRKTEYALIGEKLALSGAVTIKAMHEEQVLSWCDLNQYAALKTAFLAHTALRETLTTPLLLAVARDAFSAGDMADAATLSDAAAVKNALWAAYLRRALGTKNEAENRKQKRQYPPEKLLRWLRWLARYLHERDLTAYYIERMQPQALEEGWHRRYRDCSVGLSFGLFAGIAVGIVYGLSGGIAYGLTGGLMVGLALGMAKGLGDWDSSKGMKNISPMEGSQWNFDFKSVLRSLEIVLSGVVMSSLLSRLTGDVAFNWAVCMAAGLAIGIVKMRTLFTLKEQHLLEPNEGIRRSLRNALGSFMPGLVCLGLALHFHEYLQTNFAPEAKAPLLALLVSAVFLYSFPFDFGGEAVIQHYTLRYLLYRAGSLPFLDLVPFLERCCRLGLLRRVGGGYVFFHRELRDYLVGEVGGDRSVF